MSLVIVSKVYIPSSHFSYAQIKFKTLQKLHTIHFIIYFILIRQYHFKCFFIRSITERIIGFYDLV